MNAAAEKHLVKAEGYLGKGEEFYRKAATEIVAALEADSTLGYREIGARFGRSHTWARKIVTWAASGTAPFPFSEPHRESTDMRGAKRILAEAPLEQVESLIDALSDERKRAVAAAAGDAYLKARQDYDEEEQRKSPAQRKHEDAAASAITEAGRKAAGGFLSLGIAGHVEQATEELHELVADGSVTPQALEVITAALRALLQEYEVACAMVGLESELEVVGQ